MRNEYDKYWRLSDYDLYTNAELREELEESGLKAPSNSVRTELIRRQHLSDLGCLAYDNKAISLQELHRFIRDRGLTDYQVTNRGRNTRYSSNASKAVCVKILEAADGNRVFSRFTRLPPELREHIYQFYLNEFPETLKHPTQPPLARTCHLLRHEVLPLFYTCTTFELHYGLMNSHPASLRPCRRTAKFLETLPTSLCKIEMNMSDDDRRRSKRKPQYEIMESVISCQMSVGSPKVPCFTKAKVNWASFFYDLEEDRKQKKSTPRHKQGNVSGSEADLRWSGTQSA